MRNAAFNYIFNLHSFQYERSKDGKERKRGRLGEFIEHSFVVKWRETRANKGMIIRVGSSICAARWMQCSSPFFVSSIFTLLTRHPNAKWNTCLIDKYNITRRDMLLIYSTKDHASLSLSLLPSISKLSFERNVSHSLFFIKAWSSLHDEPQPLFIPPFREKRRRKPIIDHSLTDRVIGT